MKYKSDFQKWMVRLTFLFGVLTALFFLLHHQAENGAFLTLGITVLTVFYHLGMRLLVGEVLVSRRLTDQLDPFAPFFRADSPAERKLYQKLGVRKWKGILPTYSPEEFSPEQNSWSGIAAATCRSEVIHEINMLLSFLPLLFSLYFGAFPVFIITSVLAALFDGIFVILQRFNRPRLLRMAKREERQTLK